MVNSSLAYEILLYINSFYFGLFATCELGTLILKSVLIGGKYDDVNTNKTKLGQDYGVLVALFIVEAARLFLGRKGSLSEKDVPVMFSVLLTVPSIMGVLYLLNWQVVILRIEYIWCTLMLAIQVDMWRPGWNAATLTEDQRSKLEHVAALGGKTRNQNIRF